MKWIAPHGATSASERYVNAQPTIAGSNPDAKFFNTVLDELLAVIVAADMTPTDANLHQIADAIEYLTERAATSGVTKGSYWFGKTTANFTVPNPTLAGQNYIDFTTLNTYSAKSDLSGWTQTGTFVPPVGIDFTILITSKFWDIPEQDGQQGGWAQYNHTDDEWSWWPKIISLQDAALTGTPTAPTPTSSSPSNQIATKGYVNSFSANTNLSNLTTTGKANISSIGTYDSSATYSAGTVGAAISGKADIDLSNITADGKEVCANMAMPSDRYTQLTLGASGSTYTAPADGYFMLYAQYNYGSNAAFEMFSLDGTALGSRHFFASNDVQAAGRITVPARKNQTFRVDINGTLKNVDFKFVYANGAQ